MKKNKVVWITWENQRRNVSMSSSIGAILYVVDFNNLPIVFRYFFSIWKTLFIIIRERPDSLIVQNPSMVLSLFAVLINISKCFKFELIVDMHNAGLFPFEGQSTIFNKIRNFIVKHCDLIIVTNDELCNFVNSLGGKSIVVEDPLPSFHKNIRPEILKGRYTFLFICTYAKDEPYLELIDAVRKLNKNYTVYMTGTPNTVVQKLLNQLPDNIVVTGFLSAEEYDTMLFSVDVVIDLTFRENCLVCGAYEAVSAEKPMILSETDALKSYFGENGVVYASNNAVDIARCMKEISGDLINYTVGVRRLKTRLLSKSEIRKEQLFEFINKQ